MMESAGPSSPDYDRESDRWEIRARILWEQLIHHRTVVVLCLLAGITLGAAYTTHQPAPFEARASFLLEYEPSDNVYDSDRMWWTLHFLRAYYEGHTLKRTLADFFTGSEFLRYALQRTYPGRVPERNLRRASRLVRKRLTMGPELDEERFPYLEATYRSPHPGEARVILSGLLRSFPGYISRQFRRNMDVTLSLSRELLDRGNLKPRAKEKVVQRIRDIEFASRLDQFRGDRFVVRLLNDPRPEREPKTPVVNVLAGGSSGLIVGLLCALGLGALDPSLRTRADVQSRLDLPLLGEIPRARHPAEVPPDMTLHPRSPFAESFRRIRANVRGRRSGGEKRILVVTSPSPAEGKSTVAYNLAGAFSRQDANVLLADFDLPAGDLPRSPGTTSVLTGRCSLEEALQRRDEGFDRLPPGTLSGNAADLLTPSELTGMFDDLRRRYDRVILDTPPVLGRADTLTLSRFSDAVLLVLRARQTHLEAARRALRELREVDAHVMGCVLNDLEDAAEPSASSREPPLERDASPAATS